MGGSNYALFENGAAYPVIFAGGSINADLYARNSVSDPIGGRIGRVGAHGDIDGLFKAESSIDEVFSAGDIFAILDAPLVYPQRENDASVITEYPLPDTPESIRDDVLAEGAAAYAEVLEARDEFDVAFEEFLDAVREIEAEVHDNVANARAATVENNERIQAATTAELATATAQAVEFFANKLADHIADVNAIRRQGAKDRAEFANEIAAARQRQNEGYLAAMQIVAEAQRLMEAADVSMAQAKVQIVAIAEHRREIMAIIQKVRRKARISETMRRSFIAHLHNRKKLESSLANQLNESASNRTIDQDFSYYNSSAEAMADLNYHLGVYIQTVAYYNGIVLTVAGGALMVYGGVAMSLAGANAVAAGSPVFGYALIAGGVDQGFAGFKTIVTLVPHRPYAGQALDPLTGNEIASDFLAGGAFGLLESGASSAARRQWLRRTGNSAGATKSTASSTVTRSMIDTIAANRAARNTLRQKLRRAVSRRAALVYDGLNATPGQLADDVEGITATSSKIARRIRAGEITVNVLDDIDFAYKYKLANLGSLDGLDGRFFWQFRG